jgi:hypothetical protein
MDGERKCEKRNILTHTKLSLIMLQRSASSSEREETESTRHTEKRIATRTRSERSGHGAERRLYTRISDLNALQSSLHDGRASQPRAYLQSLELGERSTEPLLDRLGGALDLAADIERPPARRDQGGRRGYFVLFGGPVSIEIRAPCKGRGASAGTLGGEDSGGARSVDVSIQSSLGKKSPRWDRDWMPACSLRGRTYS